VLRKYDILLVADEVICGFGRTGKMFGSETFGMRPDIITVAKQLSGAYLPISAVMVNERVYRALVAESEKLGIFAHGFTYSGHPVPSAVALETLAIYEERDILGHVRSVTPAFEEGIQSFQNHPLVGEARSVGLLGALELVSDRKTKKPFERKDGLMAFATRQALSQGLIARCSGTTVTICPPLIITAGQIEDMMARFARTLDATLAWAQERQLLTLH
jgi:4-aminobutyrate--pyruvate transaminase